MEMPPSTDSWNTSCPLEAFGLAWGGLQNIGGKEEVNFIETVFEAIHFADLCIDLCTSLC